MFNHIQAPAGYITRAAVVVQAASRRRSGSGETASLDWNPPRVAAAPL